ncbi:hypothetical protein FHL15_010220 [Xylaria flabelliformis]|uniref:Uncharacterized protein n=1 Tax=Xylaria flabelliformis TaxID=2512241 RepID=A0A553HLT4_9PEZI|nr:hypothetical protein FHL15_010220 [Xylaria flabelliformis]
MKCTTAIFSLLALVAGVFAIHSKTSDFTPPFNTTPSHVPNKPAIPTKGAVEGSDNATTPGNDTVRCNRYIPFPHGPPHFAPGCTPSVVPIPHDAASRISNSYAALALGIASIIFWL